MTLSIIIVNYNVRQFLLNALASIRRAMEGIEGEVFVVDNASDDGSAAMVRKMYPDVHVIENRENVGFARANNQALAQTRGDFILLINPDTVVQEDTFRVMLKFFAEHPDAGLAGCKVLNSDGSFQLPCRRSFPRPWVAFTKVFGLSALFPHSKLFGRYNLTYRDPDKTYPVDAVSGSFMMIRRSVYDAVGGLDETFFMYGEDLDWCYRVGRKGFGVYYVHETSIIHFQGESTRRSNIDEIRVFYGAMQLFVDKHFGRSNALRVFLYLGIAIRELLAWLNSSIWPVVLAVADGILVDAALFFASWIYFRNPWLFPRGASHVVWFAPAAMVVAALAGAGAYTSHRLSASRAASGALAGFLIVSASVFFVKGLAYSRAVVLISALASIVLLPAFRLVARGRSRHRHEPGRRRSLFGSRTLIVGTGESARELLKKLRARVDDGYDVVGFIDMTNARMGESLDGVQIVGSVDNVGKVVDELRVNDVIFSLDELAYGEILGVIARSPSRSVNFRLLPNGLDAIIGKTRIDQLDTLPLVDIEYSIRLPGHRFVKRLLDLAVALPAVVVLLPAVRMLRIRGRFATAMCLMPQILRGKRSLVGLPDEGQLAAELSAHCGGADLGPIGMTGIIQINRRDAMTMEEMEQYALYYAKNQSLVLDVEILMKAMQV